MAADQKAWRKLAKKLEAQGAHIERTGSGHFKVTAPWGKVVICPSTPSEYRSMRNTMSYLRKAGFDV